MNQKNLVKNKVYCPNGSAHSHFLLPYVLHEDYSRSQYAHVTHFRSSCTILSESTKDNEPVFFADILPECFLATIAAVEIATTVATTNRTEIFLSIEIQSSNQLVNRPNAAVLTCLRRHSCHRLCTLAHHIYFCFCHSRRDPRIDIFCCCVLHGGYSRRVNMQMRNKFSRIADQAYVTDIKKPQLTSIFC